MNSKCGTHAESYMPLVILYTSIISPRQRLYLSVGKYKTLIDRYMIFWTVRELA